jgi:phage-related protein
LDIYHYESKGGKDQILKFIKGLPNEQKKEFEELEEILKSQGLEILREYYHGRFETKPIAGMYEIKFKAHNRIFYIATDKDSIYFLHACRKQKNKAEMKDIEVAQRRMNDLF